MIVVLCDGVFDLLHCGHLRHLAEARSMGDILLVGVTRDAFVNKGVGRPVIPEAERVEMVMALRCVTAAKLVDTSLKAFQAWDGWGVNIFVKGHDYIAKGLLRAEIEYCMAHGIEIRHTAFNAETTGAIVQRAKQCIS